MLAQAQEPAVESPAQPKRSTLQNFFRWISGTEKREREAAEAQAHAQALATAEHTAAEAKQERAAQAQAEREQQLLAEEANAIACIEASDQPLIHFLGIEAGWPVAHWHYAWREHFLEAREDGGDLPICDGLGNLQLDARGERRSLPIEKVQARTLRAVATAQPVSANAYALDHTKADNKTRGPRIRR